MSSDPAADVKANTGQKDQSCTQQTIVLLTIHDLSPI
jgi:hypothetical protein